MGCAASPLVVPPRTRSCEAGGSVSPGCRCGLQHGSPPTRIAPAAAPKAAGGHCPARGGTVRTAGR